MARVEAVREGVCVVSAVVVVVLGVAIGVALSVVVVVVDSEREDASLITRMLCEG